MNKEILIVDDEKDIRSSISDLLNDEDYNCRSVANSDDALFEIAKSNCKSIQSPHWINLDQDKMTASIVTEPGAEDGEIVIDTVQIVEYYSK